MKFAHEFKAALIREGFPPDWVELAIPYSQLKKILKKVSTELQDIGLDPATLAQFSPDPGEGQDLKRSDQEGAIAYKYDFEGRISIAHLYQDLHLKLTKYQVIRRSFGPS